MSLMFKKLNVLVDNLGANQLSFYLISSLNKLVGQGISPVVFYETPQKHHISPMFPTTNIVNAYGQEGIMISTTINTTLHMLSFPAQHKRFFYVWDLEWLRENKREWGFYYNVYHAVPLLVRSESHKKLIESCFNVEVDILENWDYNKLLGVI